MGRLREPALRVLVLAVLFAFGALPANAQDNWTALVTPHFQFVTNSSERSLRQIASQFERVRLAIESTWPWARVQLDRPVTIVGARDEATMRSLVPRFWEPGSQLRPVSVFVSAPDRYFIVIRTDVRADDTPNDNPYQTAYWSYTALLLSQAFEPELPLWIRNGLAGVLSNSIVRNEWVEFGRPLSAYARTFAGEARLALAALVAATAESSDYTTAIGRRRFDAQSWATVHYLLYGLPEANAGALNRIVSNLQSGRSSLEALQQEFGDVAALDAAILRYVQNGIFQYERVTTPNAVEGASGTPARLTPVEARATQAALHVAMNNAPAARALILDGAKQSPDFAGWHEAEGVLLEREGRTDDAKAAYAKAADLGSTNAYVLLRLVVLDNPRDTGEAALTRREALLNRIIAANGRMAQAHAMLADTYLDGRRTEEAVAAARRAAAIDGRSPYFRLTLARALWMSGQRDDARGQALAARSLATTPDARSAVQSMLDAFERSPPAPTTAPARAASSAPTPSNTAGPAAEPAADPSNTGTRSASGSRLILDLRPVGAGELRTLGTFQAIECEAGRILLVFDASGTTLRFGAPRFEDVGFVSFRTDASGSISCGRFASGLRALITYRRSDDSADGEGRAIAVELIPDDFTPR